jgi:hypothetical protein
MQEIKIEMPFSFRNPFENYKGQRTITVWINQFRKHNGLPVIIDWSAKAFKEYVPDNEWERAVWSMHYWGGTQSQPGYRPWKVNTHEPAPKELTVIETKMQDIKPIRKLRGILRGDHVIPGWALDASALRIVDKFERYAFKNTNNQDFTIPDCSDKRLAEIIRGLQLAVVERVAHGNSKRHCAIVVNPELAFKKDLITSLVLKSTVMDTVYVVRPVLADEAVLR